MENKIKINCVIGIDPGSNGLGTQDHTEQVKPVVCGEKRENNSNA